MLSFDIYTVVFLQSSGKFLTDDDKSMATEQIEPLPTVQTPVKQTPVAQKKPTPQKKTEKQERQVRPKTKAMRPKGRISTPEHKPARKEPVYIPREEVKKKKGMINITVGYLGQILKYTQTARRNVQGNFA